MFRDNFFHAIAMELHRSGFYQLVQLERSAFNTLSRFQADMVSLINLNENWGRIVEKEQGLLLQIHERFRNLVSCWTHFAVSDSEHLISAISGLMDVSVTKHDAIESLVTLQQEIDHEAPKKYGKIMEKALGRLSAQHHDQVDFISQLNLDRMPDAYSRFNAGPLYLKFVKTPDHKLGKTIDRLIREGIVLVREADGLDAQYFRGPSGSIEELWISWDFSNKAKVKQTYL
ncbi:MAG: hypothetical protein JW836_08770, partial [Deltaproteobacteria bacterium]|nr:hypothetical protein [Deltaproteobacteria bacterium]